MMPDEFKILRKPAHDRPASIRTASQVAPAFAKKRDWTGVMIGLVVFVLLPLAGYWLLRLGQG